MRGRPCVMSSSVYSSSSMQLNSFSRPWIRGRRCCRKHVRRDSIQVCKVHGTPGMENGEVNTHELPSNTCWGGAASVRKLTEAPYVYGDVDVSVLWTVIHGLPQGLQFSLSCSEQVNLRRTSFLQFWAFSQNLLQGQDVCFLCVRVGQKLPEHVSERQKKRENLK